MAVGAGAGGAGAAAVAQALKAFGVVVQLEPREFQQILYRADKPLVIIGQVGVVRKKRLYMFSYRGFVFTTKADSQVQLPSGAEVVAAERVWLPY